MDNQAPAPAPIAAPTQVPVLPASWPGAFGVFKHCKQVVKANLGPILGLSVLSLLLSAISRQKDESAGVMVVTLAASLLSLWVSLALIKLFIAGINSEKLSFMNALKQSGPFYLRSLGVVILSCLILFVSLIALIVPFFFVLPRLTLATYFLVDRNVGVMEAIKLSWRETKGHSLKVWGIIGVTMLFAVLCLVLVGFYLLFFYQAAFAILYFVMKKAQPATADVPVAAAPASAPVSEAQVPPAATDVPVANAAPQQPANPTDQNPTPPVV